MNLDEIIFEEYVICPLCGNKMKSISTMHLRYKHGYTDLRQFKLEFGLPLSTALACHELFRTMQKNGFSYKERFVRDAVPIGVKLAKENEVMVPKESRVHSGKLRKGTSWMPSHIEDMKGEGLIDLHEAAKMLGISYNYARKCAADGRIKVVYRKGLRFTTKEWIDDTRILLEKNRENWFQSFPEEMSRQGYFDIERAAKHLGMGSAYLNNLMVKGKIKYILIKGIRFTTVEWMEDYKKIYKPRKPKADI